MASVQRGTAARGACMSSWHSMQDVMVGKTTLDWPLKPDTAQLCPRSVCRSHTFSSSINQRL